MSLLLVHEILKQHALPVQFRVTGFDISSTAVSLAKLNKEHVFSRAAEPAHEFSRSYENVDWKSEASESAPNRDFLNMDFVQADIFSTRFEEGISEAQVQSNSPSQDIKWSFMMANPPYISPSEFSRTTARSVRKFEPKLALVPPDTSNSKIHPGDTFYPRILEIAQTVQPRCLLLEVADMNQAVRVARMVEQMSCSWLGYEIWRDDPSYGEPSKLPDTNWLVRGRGNGRSVFVHNFALQT